jgi:hypothetical protein
MHRSSKQLASDRISYCHSNGIKAAWFLSKAEEMGAPGQMEAPDQSYQQKTPASDGVFGNSKGSCVSGLPQ